MARFSAVPKLPSTRNLHDRIAGIRAGWVRVGALIAAEELTVFRDSFSLLYLTITSQMGEVLICQLAKR